MSVRYSKSTRINWKLNPNWFQTQNSKILENDFMRLGNSQGAVKAMMAKGELLQVVMPTVIGSSYESLSGNWQKEMKDYFNSITIRVPKEGFELDLTMEFDIDDSNPIRKSFIQTLKTNHKITTSEELKNYVINQNEKNQITDEFLYRYASFEVPEHYIYYIYCLGYKAVANKPDDINKSADIRFYIFSEADVQRKKEQAAKVTIALSKAYNEFIASNPTKEQYQAIYIELFPELILEAMKLNSETIQFEILKNISVKTDELTRILKNIPYYETKAMIKKYVQYNLVKHIQPDVYVDPENPSITYGDNIDAAISYFTSDNKDKKAICDTLAASFKQLSNHK